VPKVVVEAFVEGEDVAVVLADPKGLVALGGAVEGKVARLAQGKSHCNGRAGPAVVVVVVVPGLHLLSIPIDVHPAVHERQLEGSHEMRNDGCEDLRLLQVIAPGLHVSAAPMHVQSPCCLHVLQEPL